MHFFSSKSREWLIQYGIVKKIIFKFFIAIYIFSATFILSSNQIYAQNIDNDSTSLPTCLITISGIDATTNSENPNTAYKTGEGSGGVLGVLHENHYSARVCIDKYAPLPQIGVNYNACVAPGENRDLKLKTEHSAAPIISSVTTWTLDPDPSQDNCFTTTVEAADQWWQGEEAQNTKVEIDIQLDSDGGKTCPKDFPVCQRAYITLNRQMSSNNSTQCQDALANFCASRSFSNSVITPNTPITLNAELDRFLFDEAECGFKHRDTNIKWVVTDPNGDSSTYDLNFDSPSLTFTPHTIGQYTFKITEFYKEITTGGYGGMAGETAAEQDICDPLYLSSNPDDNTDPSSPGGGDSSDNSTPYFLCQQIPDPQERSACESCVKQEEITDDKGKVISAGKTNGLWTAVGCIQTSSTSILRTFITIGLSLGGSVALIMILVAGFMFSTSQGDAKRTGEAKEMLTSAIIGLLFIIFSVTILQFIGVNLLRIPGFGGL